MLKYMRDIRLAAARSQGWFKYDEQSRLRKASHPESSWGVINHEFWLLYVTGQAGSESKAQVNNTKQFSGENSPSSTIQYCYHLNQGKRCNFSPDADSSTSVEDAEANTQLPTVSTTSQLYKLGKTPIKLDRIFYHTQNYSDYHFLMQGFMHGFKLQYFGPRLPRF